MININKLKSFYYVYLTRLKNNKIVQSNPGGLLIKKGFNSSNAGYQFNLHNFIHF